MPIECSVIICSHNPRPDYLRRVMDALRQQILPMGKWEFLLIDNASVMSLADEWDLSWHPNARHIREDELGLSPARQRGMREAKTDLLIFVDDDNLLDPNYLHEAVRIKGEWPQLGVWGGSIIPEFEVPPPDHLRPFLSVLALREVTRPRWSNVATCDEAEPWGAGLCVRARVARTYCQVHAQSSLRLGDRVGNCLLSGGDTEICLVACRLGLGMGLFPTLKVVHLIAGSRLKEDYIVKITEGIKTSILLVAFKWRGVRPGSPYTLKECLRLAKQALLLRGIDRRLYFAQRRATIKAMKIIETHRAAPIDIN
jgi:glycosyltransferase involved in cell wall biosynthesis